MNNTMNDNTNAKWIDLHLHTTASDGTFTPDEVVKEAAELGLRAIAITDHDTVDGIEEALAAGEKYGLSVVPGIELSTEYEGVEIHIVGLFVDHTSQELNAQAKSFREQRDGRNLKMIERLQKYGFRITEEELYHRFPDSVVARPHMARFLHETGQAKSVKDVFDKYIGDDCPCYVHREMITPMQAVKIIHAAGGTAILAHPCLYRKLNCDTFTAMMNDLKESGLDGIEVRYSRNTVKEDRHYQEVADQYGLLYSGGSDFHGTNKPEIKIGSGTGNLFVPAEYLDRIIEYRKNK